MYFHTDSQSTVAWLAAVLNTAADNGRKIRLDVDTTGALRVKVGEGCWTSPFASTPDPYRDNSHDDMIADDFNQAQGHYHMTIV